MGTDTLSASNVVYETEAFIPATGAWVFTPRSVTQVLTIFGQGALRSASLALWLMVSPLTAIADPWLTEHHLRASTSAPVLYEGVRRRRITLGQALALADEIMRKAEEGRIRAAEEEVNRLFDLESIS